MEKYSYNFLLADTTEVDHSNYDCFVMFFMSHGEEGILYAYDNIFKAEDLFRGFTADVCTTLAGKPKMFFIQVTTKLFI